MSRPPVERHWFDDGDEGAEILGVYGIGPDGKPVPARDENGREIPRNLAPQAVPGAIPLPPGTDLPPLRPEKRQPPQRPFIVRPDLTA